MENFVPAWQDTLFSDTMQALALELVTFLIRVISTDSPSTADNQKSLQQRQQEENCIRSYVQEQAQVQPQAPWPWDQSEPWTSMESSRDRIQFLCTDGSRSSQHHFFSTNTSDMSPLHPNMLLSHKQSLLFCCSVPWACHFQPTIYVRCWNQFNGMEESLLWVPPQMQGRRACYPKVPVI